MVVTRGWTVELRANGRKGPVTYLGPVVPSFELTHERAIWDNCPPFSARHRVAALGNVLVFRMSSETFDVAAPSGA